ncbi:MAG: cystathionine gamma-synthase [Longimicrobiales bacterium]
MSGCAGRAGDHGGVDPRTALVRAGVGTDTAHGAVIPPLHLSTTFTFEGLGVPRRYDYTRSGNPTRDVAAEAVADLEGGAGAVLTASGMAAVTTVLQLLEPGDLLVAAHDAYGGTDRLISALAARGAFEVVWADLTDPVSRDAALARGPRMVWVETPSNPLLRITDLRAVADGARRHGAIVVADNTFLSPANQRPLALGADVVVHSTTKYLNGHSDMVGGAVVCADAALHERLAWWANCLGVTGAPFDAWLLMRGLRTLHARIRQHEENAERVAAALTRHPAVRRSYWPGLPDHPGHDVARTQQTGWGGMLSFELRGGREAVAAFLDGLRHVSLAESLGGVESLVAHPATMTHASMTPEARARAGIGDALLRMSVGIEAPDDLVADVVAGLDRAEVAALAGVGS